MFNKNTITPLWAPTPGANRSYSFPVHATNPRLVTGSIIGGNCRQININFACVYRATGQRDVDKWNSLITVWVFLLIEKSGDEFWKLRNVQVER